VRIASDDSVPPEDFTRNPIFVQISRPFVPIVPRRPIVPAGWDERPRRLTMPKSNRPDLRCDRLDLRDVPAVTSTLADGTLTVNGDGNDNRIAVYAEGADLLVLDGTTVVRRVASLNVGSIVLNGNGGNDVLKVDNAVTQPANLTATGTGRNKLVAGGGPTTLTSGAGNDALFGGLGQNSFNGNGGQNDLYRVQPGDIVFPNPNDRVLMEAALPSQTMQEQTLTADEVQTIIQRASAASASNDAIIVVSDRNGRILGVRVESGVARELQSDTAKLVFAVDGAYAKALTAAYFANNQAPLTSRTVQFIAQSTITDREVNSNPNITDPNSTVRGPGFVAPVAANGHFPPGIAFTPQVDLFQIEHTNRDQSVAPGPDRIIGTADDIPRSERFNIDPTYVPSGNELFVPDSYGRQSGLLPTAQSRGVATLPGGIPIYKNGQVVGGIGVFFPGKTWYATEENSSLSTTFDPSKPDRTLEAEWMAFAAVGGTTVDVQGGFGVTPIGPLGGVALPTNPNGTPIFGLPVGRIDLVGITLNLFGPGGTQEGVKTLLRVGQIVGQGDPNDGTNMPVTTSGAIFQNGQQTPTGWLVMPHDGVGITKADVERIITQGIAQANETRAAIRLPLGSRTKMVFAVTDKQGNVVGLFRQDDATIFSIDVAVAKARNVNYYADPNQLLPIDQLPGIPAGTAFTNRTFRYLAQPRFPEAIDGAPPGPFSQYNDFGANIDWFTAQQIGPPLPASQFQSQLGYDSFNPGTNFHQQNDPLNQNGIVWFPGSAPVYKIGANGLAYLAGGFGVSGDGVDQDDVVTDGGQMGYTVPRYILRADQVFVRGVRLPYQKFNRNPEG
jgi:uncharacterized protein GlcG (DUF336 family)